MDDKGQVMILESIIFTVTILLALVFLYQLSPTSTVSKTYTNDLEIKGDDALKNLYTSKIPSAIAAKIPSGFPKNQLVYYLITDDYGSLILSNLSNMLPPNTLYNIYISNGTKTVFWCSYRPPSAFDSSEPFPATEPVTISHIVIAIHPDFFDKNKFPNIIDNDGCELAKKFRIGEPNGYKGSLYDVILEMFYIGGY